MSGHADTIRRVLHNEPVSAIEKINALADIASAAVREGARLQAENQRLRAALGLIADPDYTHIGQLKSIARAALSGTPSEAPE
jgi:hypothetical protein